MLPDSCRRPAGTRTRPARTPRRPPRRRSRAGCGRPVPPRVSTRLRAYPQPISPGTNRRPSTTAAWTSSGSAWSRPCSSARAFAARSSMSPARGLAPSSTRPSPRPATPIAVRSSAWPPICAPKLPPVSDRNPGADHVPVSRSSAGYHQPCCLVQRSSAADMAAVVMPWLPRFVRGLTKNKLDTVSKLYFEGLTFPRGRRSLSCAGCGARAASRSSIRRST